MFVQRLKKPDKNQVKTDKKPTLNGVGFFFE